MCFSIAGNSQKNMTSPALAVAMPTSPVTRELIKDLSISYAIYFEENFIGSCTHMHDMNWKKKTTFIPHSFQAAHTANVW